MNFGYEEWRIVFIVTAVLCGIFLLSSVALFFILDVKGAIGHITGRTAKKQIQKIKESAHANSERLSNPGQVQNLREGRITDKISTQKLVNNTEELEYTGSNETTVLDQTGAGETTVLAEGGSNETTVLSQPVMDETSVLSQVDINATGYAQSNQSGNIFQIEFDITFIHTNEVIS